MRRDLIQSRVKKMMGLHYQVGVAMITRHTSNSSSAESVMVEVGVVGVMVEGGRRRRQDFLGKKVSATVLNFRIRQK